MTVLKLPRQWGKTSKLIKYSKETKTPILVKNTHDRDILVHFATDLGENDDFPAPVTFADMLTPGRTNRPTEVLVDDAEIMLPALIRQFLHAECRMCTLTDDERDLYEVE